LPENWFFAGNRVWPYYSRMGPWTREFWDLAKEAATVKGIAIAVLLSIIAARLGLWCGRWMLKVQR